MRFDNDELQAVADIVAEAGRREIMPRFRALDSNSIRQKAHHTDLVTEADTSAERLITASLKERFAGATVIGEEAVSEQPGLLDHWHEAELAFVIDPVDGTYNFATGIAVFGTIVAVVANGETIGGIIHDPVFGDDVRALRGAGAWHHGSKGSRSRLNVAARTPVERMTGSVSWYYIEEPVRSVVTRNMSKLHSGVGYRCAAQEYRQLASGHIHFSAYYKLMPWDHLAGVLITEEAGGHVRRWDGSAYRPEHVAGGLLATTDPESWQDVYSALWR